MSSVSLKEAVRVDPQPEAQPPALELIDDIQGVRAQLSTDRGCRPTHCSTDPFLFPVDVAYDLSPLVLRTHRLNPIIVRDTDGPVRAEITNREAASLPDGQYLVDVCSMGLKVYLIVHGELEISSSEGRRTIDCSAAESVRLGLRSFHESPTATVTTTDRPRDVMRALSCLGSALKTTSCERSFPTLRGHPPLLERGERFRDPSGLERTEETASVRIEVPPTLESIYPVAPLAYYLNAVVRPGEDSRIVADGATVPLDRGDGPESGAAQLLKRVFTLDCITRTEGVYPFTLDERTRLEERLTDAGIEIDFAALYEQTLAERMEGYVSIPFDLLDGLVPRWLLTADVSPAAKHLPSLPFIVDSLGTVRCLSTNRSQSAAPNPPEIEAFYRHAQAERPGFTRSGSTAPTRSGPSTRSSESVTDLDRPSNIHTPPETGSIAQLWLADGYPMQGAKPTLPAFERRLDAVPADTIDVAVISNDTAMQAESDVADLYNQRDRIAFDVTVHEELSKQALSAVFADDYDLVHYVGHVDTRGLQCGDGWLDAPTLDTVNARAFMLNGCRSYEQGLALINGGAIGGLCTLTNVGNTPATRIGRTVARLLNAGFSLAGALELISEEFVTGQQYMIVGDPTLAIVQSREDTPILAEITPAPDDDTFVVDIHGYPSSQTPIGMPYVPNVGENETYFLNSGHLTTLEASRTTVKEFLQHDDFLVRINGTITRSKDARLDSI